MLSQIPETTEFRIAVEVAFVFCAILIWLFVALIGYYRARKRLPGVLSSVMRLGEWIEHEVLYEKVLRTDFGISSIHFKYLMLELAAKEQIEIQTIGSETLYRLIKPTI